MNAISRLGRTDRVTRAATAKRTLNERETVRRVGLVVRVSTTRQADNDEGSLKNQLQRLRGHLEYKTVTCGEDWQEVALYELRAVSGKNSLRTIEMERLRRDIEDGNINTVLCTALDRVSRSVVDFLSFFEFMADHDVELSA
jgi:site-specific DNA recombinase